MEYEKFDIERALAGEPVILRNSTKAHIRHREEEFKMRYPLSGVVLGGERWETWMLSGSVYADGGVDDYDIVGMYPKEPLTMPDSFWDMLTPEIVAIAKDGNGRWFGYKAIPVLHMKGGWEGWGWGAGRKNNYWKLTVFNPEIFPDCKPKDSLIVRPVK